MKKHTTLSIDHEVIARCKELNIDMSNESEAHLKSLICMRGDSVDVNRRIKDLEIKKKEIQLHMSSLIIAAEKCGESIKDIDNDILALNDAINRLKEEELKEQEIIKKVKDIVLENRKKNYGDFCYDIDKVNKICDAGKCHKREVDKYFYNPKYQIMVLNAI